MPITQKICPVILITVLLSACATASSPNAAVAETAAVQTAAQKAPVIALSQAAKTEQTADEKMVCKREAVTGSRFKKKICMSEAQWAEMSEDAKKSTGEFQRKNSGVGAPGG